LSMPTSRRQRHSSTRSLSRTPITRLAKTPAPQTRRSDLDPRRSDDRFIKTGHLKVNAMIGFWDNHAAIYSAVRCLLKVPNPARPTYRGLDCRRSNITWRACCSLKAAENCALWLTT
jgi:hypothetical protein